MSSHFFQMQNTIEQDISLSQIENIAKQFTDTIKDYLQLITKTKDNNDDQLNNIPYFWRFNSHIGILATKLTNLQNAFHTAYTIMKNINILVKSLVLKKQQQQQQQQIKKEQIFYKVFEIIYRSIEKRTSIIFKPFKQQGYLHRATLQSFIEYQSQISTKEIKRQLKSLDVKINQLIGNEVNSSNKVLITQNVKENQLELQRMRSNMNEQAMRSQQQVSRLSLELQHKNQTIEQLQKSITQLQTSNQTQTQQSRSVISQQQSTIQSQQQQLKQQSQTLQNLSQQIIVKSDELVFVKKQLQETISRNSQQTMKIIQENGALKKKLEEKDQEIQRLNEEVGFLELATKNQRQDNQKQILKEIQQMKKDEMAMMTKKNRQLQSQKVLLQTKLRQKQQSIKKYLQHNREYHFNIMQLKQSIIKRLDRLSDMQNPTVEHDKLVNQLNYQIYEQSQKIQLLQQQLKCQTERIKRLQLPHRAAIEKAVCLTNRLHQTQQQCERLRQQLRLKSSS